MMTAMMMLRKCKVCYVVLVLIGLNGAGVMRAATVQEVFREAVAAYNAGDIDTARSKLQIVLEKTPSHPAALAYMKQIELQERQPKSIESQVSEIMLSGTNFKEASLASVLDYLSQQSAEATGGANGVSFVAKLPAKEMHSRRVTLSLVNRVPMTEILRYVSELAGVVFRYETYAIVVEDVRTRPAMGSKAISNPQP